MNVFYFVPPWHPFEGKRTLECKSGDLARRIFVVVAMVIAMKRYRQTLD